VLAHALVLEDPEAWLKQLKQPVLIPNVHVAISDADFDDDEDEPRGVISTPPPREEPRVQ
jgi:hypothetical protein